MTVRYLYLFNVIASVFIGYLGFQRNNDYILLSCIFTFLVSSYCFITSFIYDLKKDKPRKSSRIEPPRNQEQEPRLSTITKGIVNKTHGGRKISKKYWGTGKAFTQIPIKSDQNSVIEVREKASNNSFSNYILSSWSLVILLTVTLVSGSLILIPPYLKSRNPEITTSKTIQFNPRANNKIGNNQQSGNINVTKAKLKKAIEEAAGEKKAEQLSRENSVVNSSKPLFQYEIELDSGDMIYADYVKSTGNKVTCTNNTGLIVTVDADKIKSMKLIKDF